MPNRAASKRKLTSRCTSSVMTTIWGDEGNEFDFYSALPGMLYQAEHAYTPRDVDEVDATLLRRKFDGIVGADLDDYIYASKLEYVLGREGMARIASGEGLSRTPLVHSDTQPETQPIDAKTHYCPNLAKFLLWEGNYFPSRVEAQGKRPVADKRFLPRLPPHRTVLFLPLSAVRSHLRPRVALLPPCDLPRASALFRSQHHVASLDAALARRRADESPAAVAVSPRERAQLEVPLASTARRGVQEQRPGRARGARRGGPPQPDEPLARSRQEAACATSVRLPIVLATTLR